MKDIVRHLAVSYSGSPREIDFLRKGCQGDMLKNHCFRPLLLEYGVFLEELFNSQN